jgi:hypothetical protein
VVSETVLNLSSVLTVHGLVVLSMIESTTMIHAFVRLVKEKSPAFSAKAWQDLSRLDQALGNLRDNQNFLIANTILDWCDELKHEDVKAALLQMAKSRPNLVSYDKENSSWQGNSSKWKSDRMDNRSLVRKTIQEALRRYSSENFSNSH